ncbi:MAG: sugar transferase [Candidatus Omnitrophica bacterium]|nr:sugar transferase [Candidatus Omnitrophota bacterium]
MIKERVQLFRKLMIFGDLCIVAAAFFLGYILRDRVVDVYPLKDYLGLLPAVMTIWGVLLYSFGIYDSFRTKTSSEFIVLILRIAFIGFIVLGGVLYILKVPHISRNYLSFVFVYCAGLLIIEKIALMNVFRFFRRKGLNYRVLMIVGTGKRAEGFVSMIKEHKEWGLRIHGLIDEDPARKGQYVAGSRVIGSFDDFEHIIHNNVIDQVVFIVPRSWFAKIEPLVSLAEVEGIKISIAIDFFNFKISRAKQSDLYGFPLITFDSAPDKLWHLLAKRLMDVVLSGISLVVLAPVFLVIAVIIKATSDGPVFFSQKRVSLNNRIFTMYKFRTMVKDAEEQLGALLLHNQMKGPAFKMTNDPRLTPIGKFLRKHSLDELPQLWNVFKGNMSLVGPRPPLPSEVKDYLPWQRRKLSMRPGMTCIWQTSGRSSVNNVDEWMKMDLEYIDNWSLPLDLKLLLKTVPAVVFGTGAH